MEASALRQSAALPALAGRSPLLRLQTRRAPDRAHPARPPRRLRGARAALPAAAARLLPPHARLAGGRRGRAPGGLRRRLQRDAAPTTARSTRARGSTGSPATAASTTCAARSRPARTRWTCSSATAAPAPRTPSTSARSSARSSPTCSELPETQRTALLLREIDALSYDQIAEAMDTTVPSVKSLLVRARVSLAEAAEARLLTCDGGPARARPGGRGPRPHHGAGAPPPQGAATAAAPSAPSCARPTRRSPRSTRSARSCSSRSCGWRRLGLGGAGAARRRRQRRRRPPASGGVAGVGHDRGAAASPRAAPSPPASRRSPRRPPPAWPPP